MLKAIESNQGFVLKLLGMLCLAHLKKTEAAVKATVDSRINLSNENGKML